MSYTPRAGRDQVSASLRPAELGLPNEYPFVRIVSPYSVLYEPRCFQSVRDPFHQNFMLPMHHSAEDSRESIWQQLNL